MDPKDELVYSGELLIDYQCPDYIVYAMYNTKTKLKDYILSVNPDRKL